MFATIAIMGKLQPSEIPEEDNYRID